MLIAELPNLVITSVQDVLGINTHTNTNNCFVIYIFIRFIPKQSLKCYMREYSFMQYSTEQI
jgi:hypothetical protein